MAPSSTTPAVAVPTGGGGGGQQLVSPNLFGTTTTTTMTDEDGVTTSNDLRTWLSKTNPRQLSALDKFELDLRLGRLSTSGSTAAARSSSSSSSNNNDGYVDRRLVTHRTVELLRQLIGSTKWKTAGQLLVLLRSIGRELHSAGGFREPAIGNVVRRVMSNVREELARVSAEQLAKEEEMERGGGGGNKLKPISEKNESSTSTTTTTLASQQQQQQRSLASMLWAHPQHISSGTTTTASSTTIAGGGGASSSGGGRKMRSESFGSVHSNDGTHLLSSSSPLDSLPPSFHVIRPELRQAVMEAIQEMMNELEDVHKMINDQALSHIHADEIILTYGRSRTVELFLKAAALKKRKFQVVVCESAPHFGGHTLAKSLATHGIETLVINDSATFAIMARVNKVLLPAHAVLANGGLVVSSGSHLVALAAKQNAVPVVCITGMFKLCPRYPHEGQDTLNDLVSPSSLIHYDEMGSDPLVRDVEYVNPVHDYIPPSLINLYVTNIGGFQPSYIYRLLNEYYHSDDWESFE